MIRERCINHIKDPNTYGPLVMMPEGATTNGKALLKFQKGAFMNMTPVNIVCFKYQSDKYNLCNIGLRGLFGRMIFLL